MVTHRTYHPDRGDIILMNFFPSAGREIDKKRPAIVLSPLAYNRKTGLCLAVPTTTNLTPGPMWIKVPDGLLEKPSLILCDFVKSFDYRERSAVFLKKAPRELVNQIVECLLDLIDPID